MDTFNVAPNIFPAPSLRRQYPVYVPESLGASNSTDNCLHSFGGTLSLNLLEFPPILSPLTNTNSYKYNQSQVPVFATCQVLINVVLGWTIEPDGYVTSRTSAKLLHPYDNVEGFGVAV